MKRATAATLAFVVADARTAVSDASKQDEDRRTMAKITTLISSKRSKTVNPLWGFTALTHSKDANAPKKKYSAPHRDQVLKKR